MSLYFPNDAELGRHTIFPGVHIRTAAADRMMLSVVDLEPHSVVAERPGKADPGLQHRGGVAYRQIKIRHVDSTRVDLRHDLGQQWIVSLGRERNPGHVK